MMIVVPGEKPKAMTQKVTRHMIHTPDDTEIKVLRLTVHHHASLCPDLNKTDIAIQEVAADPILTATKSGITITILSTPNARKTSAMMAIIIDLRLNAVHQLRFPTLTQTAQVCMAAHPPEVPNIDHGQPHNTISRRTRQEVCSCV